MSDTSVINLIIDKAVAQLTLDLMTNVAETDPTRAGLVRGGLLQANPIPGKINVLVFENDPEKPDAWLHSTVDYDIANGVKNPPAYEIGGGFMWWRRFTVTFTMFWQTTTERQIARTQANVVLSRAEKSLRRANFALSDTFGEAALQQYLMKDQISDGGGGAQFIHYGKIWWQVLTGTQ